MLSSHPFTPPKLSAYVDEAKTYAAEYTLQALGITTDAADAQTAAAATASATAFPGLEKIEPEMTPYRECLGDPLGYHGLDRVVCELHLP